MILRGWEIEGFGIFRGTALEDLPTGLTVLLGPNEAGKSTLLAFLRFMLFGFSRGQQQKYPPLQGGRHGGRLVFEDGEGSWTLERIQGQPPRLFAPDGRILGEEVLRTRLGGLDADTFKSVFAFSLFELTNLESLDREGVRDRLYSAGITGAGRSASSVLGQLRKGAEGYLRPRSKEGVINKLSDALSEARRELAAATALAGRYDEIQQRMADAERRAEELQEEATRLEQGRSHLERLEALYVPWNRLQRLEEEVAGVYAPPAVDRLVVQRIEAGRGELTETKDAAERQRSHCGGLEERMAREEMLLDKAILGAVQPLQAALQETALQRDRMERSERLGREIAVQEAKLAQTASNLGVPAAAKLPAIEQGQLRAVDEAIGLLRQLGQVRGQREAEEENAGRRLRDAEAGLLAVEAQAASYRGVPDLEAYQARDAALQRHQDAIERLARRRGQILTPGIIALGLLAIGLVAVGLQDWILAGLAPLGLFAFLAVVFYAPGREMRRAAAEVRLSAKDLGLSQPLQADAAAKALSELHAELGRTTAATAWRDRLRVAEEERAGAERQLAECRARLEDAVGKEQEALAALQALKASIGVPQEVSPQYLPSYLTGVQAMAAVQAELMSLVGKRAAEETEIASWQARAEALCRQLGSEPPGPREALLAAIGGFSEPLQAALRRETAFRLLRDEYHAALRQLEELTLAANEAAKSCAEDLGEAGLEDLAAFERWREERQAYLQRLHDRDLAAAAFHDQAGREDETFAAELGQGSPEKWQAERLEIEQSLREMRDQRDLSVRESQDLLRLRREIAESADVPTLAERCAELEEDLRRAGEAWRLQALAQRLLERTLEVYVQSRQPEVLRIASDAFQHITAARYREVRQRADGQGLLAMPQSGAPKEPGELSRGTQEQLYLALRLGLAASYGERVAALPLVLDDVAVNFDPDRQAALLHVLGRFAAEPGRQALFFTCQPALAQAAQTAVPGLRVVDMARQDAHKEVAAGADEPLAASVVRLLAPGPLAAREIARLAGVAEQVLKPILQGLVAEGRVAAIGSGRGRRYGLA